LIHLLAFLGSAVKIRFCTSAVNWTTKPNVHSDQPTTSRQHTGRARRSEGSELVEGVGTSVPSSISLEVLESLVFVLPKYTGRAVMKIHSAWIAQNIKKVKGFVFALAKRESPPS